MLILTRRVCETIMVGDDVTLTVLGVKGNQVRCGINAPMEVEVHREEIYDKIQREKREAAGDIELPSEPEIAIEPEPEPEPVEVPGRYRKPKMSRKKAAPTKEINGNH